MIQSPARYAPDRHPDAARARRDQVIAAMAHEGMLDAATAQRETASPFNLTAFENGANEFAPYYIDSVNRAVENAPGNLSVDTAQNPRVQTTIDPDLQAAAVNVLRHQLDLLAKSRAGKGRPQGALVALDVHSGDVLAMVGGRNYAESQLNRATDAQRQPGSVFKPFVYAAALESGISPLSLFRDAPQTFQYGSATYSPANYGNGYSMHDVMLRDALVHSLNVVTVDVALRTGLLRVADTAADFGLPKPNGYPSMALGTSEVTPLQIAAAYAAFANGGARVEPRFFIEPGDSPDVQLPADTSDRKVISSATAYMITDMLSDVVKRGTARKARGSFPNVAIAGKTGTSHDGWFVGYTPNLVCVVWIGFDDNQQLGMTGAEAALPAWIDFMQAALRVRPSLGGASFPKPGGILTVKVDPESGALAGPACPSSEMVSVSYRFAPALECYKHLPPIDSEIETSEVEEESVSAIPPTESAVDSDSGSRPDPSNDPLAAKPKPARRPTQTETNKRGQRRLVSDPVPR